MSTLFATTVASAKPKDRSYKMFDGGGLHLFVKPNGSKLWRLTYSWLGKQKTLSFGQWPEVTLADAREKRTEARRLIALGTDPAQQQRIDAARARIEDNDTFKAVALEWVAKNEREGIRVRSLTERNTRNLPFIERYASRPTRAPATQSMPCAAVTHLPDSDQRLRNLLGGEFALSPNNARHCLPADISSGRRSRYRQAMTKGVFIHRADSIYDDSPAERYQFPKSYLSRVSACIGDWIIYYEPSKVPEAKGYFAVAKVADVVADPTTKDMYLALIEPGTYLDFVNPVPFNGPLGVVEKGVLNAAGKNSGRAQAAVRSLAIEDFNRIIDLGLSEEGDFLPRIDPIEGEHNVLREERLPFVLEIERDRVEYLGSRLVRDRLFRRRIVTAYDARCAITGLKLINGGGRAEVEAAHIRPVERGGPDIVNNGLALSGTVHWMFDRGLISLQDDLEILVSRQANDPDSIRSLINRTGFAIAPARAGDRPHPSFLSWHRDNCFKQ